MISLKDGPVDYRQVDSFVPQHTPLYAFVLLDLLLDFVWVELRLLGDEPLCQLLIFIKDLPHQPEFPK